MKSHSIIRASWFVVNALLAVSLVAVFYSGVWEFSTRSYLRGFSDAIIPASASPQQRIETILQWMAHGPARRSVDEPSGLEDRNPEDTLNIRQLLQVCGTATNAFVNLARSSGLRARRLLLLDERGLSKHVVVEVLLGDRWIIVDPSYHFMPRLPDGHFVTRMDMKDPATFRAATQSIPNYPQSYTYEHLAHIRLTRIPFVGRALRGGLDFIWPSWEESIDWTLLLERESFAFLCASIFLVCFAMAARLLLGWYCSRKLGIPRIRLRDQFLRVGHILAGHSH
jgi:hypothetical protein